MNVRPRPPVLLGPGEPDEAGLVELAAATGGGTRRPRAAACRRRPSSLPPVRRDVASSQARTSLAKRLLLGSQREIQCPPLLGRWRRTEDGLNDGSFEDTSAAGDSVKSGGRILAAAMATIAISLPAPDAPHRDALVHASARNARRAGHHPLVLEPAARGGARVAARRDERRPDCRRGSTRPATSSARLGAGASAPAPAVLTGSHIDTVPEGGTLDGALGVLAGLECLHTIREAGARTRRPLAVAAWSDEEGRYGSLFGSRAFCGKLDAAAIPTHGRRSTAIRSWTRWPAPASTPLAAPEATRDPRAPSHAYVELHIEQGPRLEDARMPIGVGRGASSASAARASSSSARPTTRAPRRWTLAQGRLPGRRRVRAAGARARGAARAAAGA